MLIERMEVSMKRLLEVLLSIVLHPVALVLMIINVAGRSDLSGSKKVLWIVVGLLWGIGEILYLFLGDGNLW
jgi:hypothetical protein